MNLIFLGPPGAGKGTIAAKVKSYLNIPHISTGDLFREAIKNQTDLGKEVQKIIERGDLVPDSLTVAMVRERLNLEDVKNGFILDGFPRTIPQAENLEKITQVTKVINFTLADEEIVKRLSGRRLCKVCGSSHHIIFMPPKEVGICDNCGGELFTRKDDTEESIKNRLEVYKNQTEPLIAFYKAKNLLVDIDASPEPGEVFASTKLALS